MSLTLKKLALLAVISRALAAPLQLQRRVAAPGVVTEHETHTVYATAFATAAPSSASSNPETAAAGFTQSKQHSHHSKSKKKSSTSSSVPTVATAVHDTQPSTTKRPTTTKRTNAIPKTSKTASVKAESTPATSASKRGIPYNDASLTTPFEGTKVSWAYNWASSPGGLDTSAFEYVPQLWSTGAGFVSDWAANAKSAINGGSQHLLYVNEPDLDTQANMSPEDAAAGFKTYMMPFANSGVKLGSPAVTNGAAPMGLTWLSNFLDACKDCQVDFAAVHWYDSYSNVAYFKQHLQDAHDQTGLPVWLTEFGTIDGTSEQISGFLQEVLPWMDEQDWIERYAYFMASDGKMLDGEAISEVGKSFATD